MIEKYGNQCLCFVISEISAREYLKRAKVRENTLNPIRNEHMKQYNSSAEIQKHLEALTGSYNHILKQRKEPENKKNYIHIITNYDIESAMTNIDYALQDRVLKIQSDRGP